eukprot:6179766-Pleurochrysis_carterae.AAC.2
MKTPIGSIVRFNGDQGDCLRCSKEPPEMSKAYVFKFQQNTCTNTRFLTALCTHLPYRASKGSTTKYFAANAQLGTGGTRAAHKEPITTATL